MNIEKMVIIIETLCDCSVRSKISTMETMEFNCNT